MRRIGAGSLLGGVVLFWLCGAGYLVGDDLARTGCFLIIAGIIMLLLAGDGSVRSQAVAPAPPAERRPNRGGRITIGVADQ